MKVFIIAAAAISQATAWWGKGHEIVAQIAYDKLKAESPASIDQINKVLGFLTRDQPSILKEKNYPMIEGSTWADDVKAKGGSFQNEWHFSDEPVFDDNTPQNQFTIEHNPQNVTLVIPELIKILKKQSGYENTYTYQTIRNNPLFQNEDADDIQSIALRLLIHYVGDVHQPLHAASRYNANYKKGDKGGNFFGLQVRGGAKNRHSAWDSVMYEFTGFEQNPMDEATHSRLVSDTQKIVSRHPVSAAKVSDLNPRDWV